jgi:deoxyribodipyrimidine photo-lyase
MSANYNNSLFIFRRDLRLDDNYALLAALEQSKFVIPIFIFDPRQISKTNQYRSMNCMQFMIESLQDLKKQLKKKNAHLYLFYGVAEKIIENLINEIPIDAVFINKDYTPFSLKRDEAIEKVCISSHINFHAMHDALLINPDEIKTGNGTPYTIFTPFFKKCMKELDINKPQQNNCKNFYTKKIDLAKKTTIYSKIVKVKNKDIFCHGGRTNGLKILKNIKKFKDYAKTHDFPSKSTTGLSPHHKFGTISIRESYHVIVKNLGASHLLIRQLYWRDFFTYVAYHSPFVFGQPYYEKYKNLWWENNKEKFRFWCQGKTGFPIIDAGMRQLNKTGFMHNRVRLIVSSFLIKDLHIDWQWGEKYFAQHLIDYDPALNNGNWQWSASTGCDAQPYFRIFNPWTQQKKFDPHCEYIKKWVPELKKIEPRVIHSWFNQKKEIKNYTVPIINHNNEAKYAKEIYKSCQK